MKKIIVVYSSWDNKKKSGGWSAMCNGRIIDGKQYATTSDKLVLTGLTEGVKEFAEPGDELMLKTTNSRVKNAIRHPASSIHCDAARQFKAAAKAAGAHYSFR